MDSKSHYSPRNILGLVLIVFGMVFLLENLGFLQENIVHLVFSFPGALLLIGLVLMLNNRNKILGSIMFALGGFIIALRVIGIPITGHVNFPLILILFGVYIIFRNREYRNYKQYKNKFDPFVKNETVSDDHIEEVAIFGGGERYFHSQNFQGGSVTAVFGGSKLDLTECKLAPGEQVIDIVAIFGGVEVIVPSNWKVVIDVTPIFGGFSNKWRRDPNLVLDQTSTLRIKGTVIFGGGEVKFH